MLAVRQAVGQEKKMKSSRLIKLCLIDNIFKNIIGYFPVRIFRVNSINQNNLALKFHISVAFVCCAEERTKYF